MVVAMQLKLLLVCCIYWLQWHTGEAVPHSGDGGEGHHDFPFACSSEFVFHQNHCYRYFGRDVEKPFHHAQKACMRHQSALLSVHSWEEEVFVVELAQLNESSIWLGLNDQDGPEDSHKEGNFKWSSGGMMGSAASYYNWKIGEPENKRHLDCVKMDAEGWSMAPGGCAATRLPFVCKKRGCRIGKSCTEPSAAEATPTQLRGLSAFLILGVLLGIGLVGGACCYDTIQTRATGKTELFPT